MVSKQRARGQTKRNESGRIGTGAAVGADWACGLASATSHAAKQVTDIHFVQTPIPPERHLTLSYSMIVYLVLLKLNFLLRNYFIYYFHYIE